MRINKSINKGQELKTNSLAVKAPHLVSEFHQTLNDFKVHQITYSSTKKVWWQCKKGHVWIASVGNRYRGTGCPECSGRKLSKANNLAVKCPHLIPEWHPEKNGKISPYDVTARGKIKVWWLCSKGHEWEATTGNRYVGTGCPHCDGRRVSSKHNLAVKHPELIKQWHFEINHDLKPEQVTPGSPKRVWWVCAIGHEWQAAIQARTRGQNCPYCAGKRASKENNLAVNCPELIPEWHPDKNEFSPEDITSGSKKLVWWKCKRGHEWQAQAYTRSNDHGCPKCNFRSSRLEVKIYCEFKHIFPDAEWQTKIEKREVDIFIPCHSLAIEVDGWYWHKSDDRINADKRKNSLLKKKGITLIRVVDNRIEIKKSTHFVTYKNGEHDYDVIVRLLKFIVDNFKLSSLELKNIKKYLLAKRYMNDDEYNGIMTCLPGPLIKDSVMNNVTLLKEWNYDKNIMHPSQYSCGSKMKAWWICQNRHEWEATIGSRSAGRGCPFCQGKVPSVENNLLVKKPELAREFHPTKNAPLTPDKILPRSNKKIWWKCKKSHEWLAAVDNRYNGASCPDCAGKKLSANHNLAVKYPSLIKQWHSEKNAPLTPYDVTPKSFIKVWWVCDKGHEWQARIEKRTRGRGCHVCMGQSHLLSN